MKRTPARHLQSLALLLVLTCAGTARAEPDTFGTGTGRDGAFIAFSQINWVNRYSPVTHALAPGDTTIGVPDSNSFEAGNLVLVLQVAGQPPAPDGDGVTWLSGTHIARFEFGRIGSVGSETSFTLTAPLQKAFDAGSTQVITVPEFTSVTLGAGKRIEGKPWDGQSGGVIAMLVTGAVNNNGAVSADGLGFRGGSYVQDTSGTLACTALDLAPPQGAQRGEGVVAGRYGPTETGRRNVAGAGGGGVCLGSGGGGGALYGIGGRGGRSDGVSDGARSVGGNEGLPVVSNFVEQLVFGSGGGSGHGDGSTGGAGGAGGGAVLIRADRFIGSGSYSANGASGYSAAGDGASGGGAGGSLQLRAVNDLSCGSATANGGAGGDVALPRRGPGGGGGGGRVLEEGCSISCTMQVGGGAAGVQTDAGATGGEHYGAAAGSAGGAMNGPCFIAPGTPSITAPTSNATVQTPQLVVTGTASSGDEVVVSLDGLEVGTTTATNTGAWTYLLSGYGNGAHSVQAAVERAGVQSPRSGAVPFTVDFPKDLEAVAGDVRRQCGQERRAFQDDERWVGGEFPVRYLEPDLDRAPGAPQLANKAAPRAWTLDGLEAEFVQFSQRQREPRHGHVTPTGSSPQAAGPRPRPADLVGAVVDLDEAGVVGDAKVIEAITARDQAMQAAGAADDVRRAAETRLADLERLLIQQTDQIEDLHRQRDGLIHERDYAQRQGTALSEELRKQIASAASCATERTAWKNPRRSQHRESSEAEPSAEASQKLDLAVFGRGKRQRLRARQG